MTERHHLSATPKSVHWGYFDAKIPPALRVRSGDQVTIESISGNQSYMPPADAGYEILPEYEEIFAVHRQGLGPHIMTGPIYVEGADPGDTLEVRILDIQLRQSWGYNVIRPLAGALAEDFGQTRRIIHIPIDIQAKTARLPWGDAVAVLWQYWDRAACGLRAGHLDDSARVWWQSRQQRVAARRNLVSSGVQ